MPVLHHDVVCPFCALGCDDLEVEAIDTSLNVRSGLAPGCRAGFAQPLGDAQPRVDGQPASLDTAVARAAAILAQARLPLIHGLGTDTAGLRAALRLAELAGGIVDHMNSQGLLANIRVMQTVGWVTATLAEARARAELIVFFGTDAARLMPRFFERVVWPDPLPVPTRKLVFVGADPPAAANPPAAGAVEAIACAPERLLEAAAALRALVAGRKLARAVTDGLPVAELEALAAELRTGRYSIIVWATGNLPPATAELTVSSLAELLKSLNATTRALGLPLAGPGNVIGANQVTGWSWGTPVRSSVATGEPDYEPEAWSASDLLATGTADAQVWISSFEATGPPASDLPTVALVRSGASFEREPSVVIPVGTPGLDHPGSLFRTDSVVALPLRRLRATDLPRVADVLRAIARRFTSERPA